MAHTSPSSHRSLTSHRPARRPPRNESMKKHARNRARTERLLTGSGVEPEDWQFEAMQDAERFAQQQQASADSADEFDDEPPAAQATPRTPATQASAAVDDGGNDAATARLIRTPASGKQHLNHNVPKQSSCERTCSHQITHAPPHTHAAIRGRGTPPSTRSITQASPTGAAAHARRGRGSRGGTNPPRDFRVPSNGARTSSYLTDISPANVLGEGEDAVTAALDGADRTDFLDHQQMPPTGEAILNPILISRLWTFDFNNNKSLVLQRSSLAHTNFIPPNMMPIIQGHQGVYWDRNSLVGSIWPLRMVRDPGATLPRFIILPWTDANGKFK